MTPDEFDEFCDIMRILIVQLEERIVALELKLDRSRDPNPPDGYYFDY